jgi:hypothetical protein
LDANGANRLQPTGISEDRQTLFLWSETEQTELVANVNPASGAFEDPTDIGPLRGATPNAACTRLYYSATLADDTSLDLYVGSLD